MRKNYFVVFLMSINFCLFAQNVNIPDANFLNALIALGVDKNNDSIVQVSEVEKIIELDIDNKNISDLTGIEAFVNLEVLECQYNSLTSLDISKNSSLKTLECFDNQLTSLDISQNDSLKFLWCSSNQLTSLDVSNNPLLEKLHCRSNDFTSLDVSQNDSLKSLDVRFLHMTSLDVSNNPLLEDLWCNDNNLTGLDVSNNPLLEYLSCNHNDSLKSLDLGNNPLLDHLDCRNINLKSLNLSKNPVLDYLSCSDNQLTSLDVSQNFKLRYLDCHKNQITDLVLSKDNDNPTFDILDCSNNSLTSIDVSRLPNLRVILAINCTNLKCLSYLPATMIQISLLYTSIECVPNIPTGIQEELAEYVVCDATNNKNRCQVYPHVQGNVFVDLDLDQEKDELEIGYQGVKIASSLGNSFTYTDDQGNYVIATKDTGNYTLTIENPLYYSATPNEINGNFASWTDIDTHNIALQAEEDVNDLVVKIASFTTARPGFNMIYFINYWNKGTQTINEGEIKFVMPSAFILEDSSMFASVDGQTLTYHAGSLASGQSGTFCIHGKTELETLGLDQEAMISIYDVAGLQEHTPHNNGDTVQYVITGSFDPNDKFTRTTITPDEVEAGTFLDYRIRFQNTGTDTAFTVVVTDTLSPLVDLSTLKIISSSHTMSATLEGNVLTFTFNNILLADSNVNEPASHGYIYYKIQPLKSLKLKDEILNTANIYFDFNKPVITNTTVTTVQEPAVITNNVASLSSNVTVYPNPSQDFVQISSPVEKESVKIINAMGVEQEIVWESNQRISVKELPNGIYTLQFTTEKGESFTTQLFVQD